ncbi:MAG: hypothetical protein ACREC5_01475 [Thermoplasmata archaeon]
MNGTSKWTRPAPIAAVFLVVATLALSALAGTAAAGAPAASGGTAEQTWAYGAQQNYSVNVGTNSTGYFVAGYFAYQVVLTQKNTSNSTFELELHRSVGFAYTGQYCLPACRTNARVAISIEDRAGEEDVGFANFTRNGTAFENGSAVPALALVNASAQTETNLTEVADWALHAAHRNLTGNLSVEVAIGSQSSVQFTPALGLIPQNLTPGARWNTTSAFDAQGSVNGSVTQSRENSQGLDLTGRTTWSPAMSRSGTVQVHGRDLGMINLHGGATVPVLGLAVGGPFSAWEGILFVPSIADLFGPGASAYSGVSAGTVGAATSTVDWAPGDSGPAGPLASSTALDPAPDGTSLVGGDPATIAGSTSGATGLAAPSSAGGTTIQAEPKSVGRASKGSGCISQDNCASVPSPGLAAPAPGFRAPAGHFFGILLTAVVVVGLAGLLAGLEVRRRRSVPAPPTATPFASSPAAPIPPGPARPGPGSGESAPEDDPLGTLW